MDLLFSRYASPFSLLDGVIYMRRFSSFIDEMIESENEKILWDFYLHRVFDKSFAQFKRSFETHAVPPSEERIEATVTESKSMLKQFIPGRG